MNDAAPAPAPAPDADPYLPPLVPTLPRPQRSDPGIARSLVLCAIYLTIVIGFSVGFELLKYFSIVKLDDFLVLSIGQIIGFVVTLGVGFLWSGVRFREACPLTDYPRRILPALILTCFGACIVLNVLATFIPMPEWFKKALTESFANAHPLYLFISVVIAAPVGEELLFRGLILRGYLGRYSVATAVWASSIVFALIHLNPWQAVVALPLGLLFSWLYLRTRSLIPAIVGHMSTNFTGMFLMTPLAAIFGYDEAAMKALDFYPAPIVAVGVAATAIGGFILWRQLPKVGPPPLRPESPPPP